jgi:Tol biopolymer transport system component
MLLAVTFLIFRSILTPAQDVVSRAVWTGAKVDLFGRVSPNGEFISFTDWAGDHDLAIHDLRTNTDRLLTANRTAQQSSVGEAQWSAISPDSQQVAYTWVTANGTEVRIAAAASPKPARTLLTLKDTEVAVRDWSPDGKLLALNLSSKDSTDIAVATVADGSIRHLASHDLRSVQRMFFSRDARYLAFDVPAPSDDDQQRRDVFIMRVSDGREVRAVSHDADDVAAGWSTDGAQLLFTSDRDGTRSLWKVSVSDGRTRGRPEMVRSNVSSSISLGVTDAGVVHLYRHVGNHDVRVAPIDLSAGTVGRSIEFTRGVLPSAMIPHWSPDGRFLLYQTKGDDEGLAIRTIATGEVRRMRVGRKVPDPRWSPDGRSILVGSTDNQGREGIVQIDVPGGRTRLLVRTDRGGGFTRPRWSPDNTRIYYVAPVTRGEVAIHERELRSGVEREVLRGDISLQYEVAPTPGGQFLAVAMQIDPATVSVFLKSISGSERRELLRLPAGTLVPNAIAWAPDGRSLLNVRRAGKSVELWLVDVNSGRERKLAADTSSWALTLIDGPQQPPVGASLSPDGRSIAFVAGKSGTEVWAVNGPPSSIVKR